MLKPKDLCQGSGTKTFLEAMNSGKVHLARFVLDALDCRIINSKNESSRTPLMCAVCLQEQSTRDTFTLLLLEKGADVNIQDEHGRTALSLACEQGHLDAVKLLVQFNADPELTDSCGNSALAYAAYGGHSQVLDFLIRAFKRLGLRLDCTNHAGHSPIQVAQNLGHAHCVQVLNAPMLQWLSSVEKTHKIGGGGSYKVAPLPKRLPKQILEKFSKQVRNKNEDTLPSFFQRQMWISDENDLNRQFIQQCSPETANSALTGFPERCVPEKDRHVLLNAKRSQDSTRVALGRINNFVSEHRHKIDQQDTTEHPPQWGKGKLFNLDLQTNQGEARNVTKPASRLKRASLLDVSALALKFDCHDNTSANKSDEDRVSLHQVRDDCVRDSDMSDRKNSPIKRSSVDENQILNELNFSRDLVPRERMRTRPPALDEFGRVLLRRFTAPEFMGLLRDGPSERERERKRSCE